MDLRMAHASSIVCPVQLPACLMQRAVVHRRKGLKLSGEQVMVQRGFWHQGLVRSNRC